MRAAALYNLLTDQAKYIAGVFFCLCHCEFAYMIYYGPTVLNYCILDEDQVRNLAYLWQVMPLGSDSCHTQHPTLRGVPFVGSPCYTCYTCYRDCRC